MLTYTCVEKNVHSVSLTDTAVATLGEQWSSAPLYLAPTVATLVYGRSLKNTYKYEISILFTWNLRLCCTKCLHLVVSSIETTETKQMWCALIYKAI